MAEFRLSRFKYKWKGNWSGTTAYIKDDIVHYNGSSYVCIVAHTSTNNFYAEYLKQDLVNNVPTPYWVKMTEGYVWTGDWESTTAYKIGDIVKLNGNVYICVTNHTSGANFNPADGNWETYVDSTKFRQDWTQNTNYELNDIVRYGGTVYLCINKHTSSNNAAGLEANLASWEVYYSGVEYRGEFTGYIKYKINDLVLYKATLLRCTTAYTSTHVFDETKWAIELPGQLYQGDWDPATYYSVGNIVKYGGYLYYSLTNNFNELPNASIYDLSPSDTAYWQILYKGINFAGTWNVSSEYKAGDVVRRGGSLYVALIDTTLTEDGSSLDYLDTSNWELLTTGYNYAGNWLEVTPTGEPGEILRTYGAGDIVRFIGNTYRALVEHVPLLTNAPNTPAGPTYWELVLKAGPNTGLQIEGDLLTYGFDPLDYGNYDALKPINVEIGTPGQLLNIGLAELVTEPDPPPPVDVILALEKKLEYKTWGVVSRLRHVSTDGVDDDTDPERGISPFKPWRTIRFAASRLDDNFNGNSTISVGVGVYEEVLPIVIPKNTVVLGSELRSTLVRAAGPVAALQGDYVYTRIALSRLIEIIENVILGNPITKTTTNTLDQVLVGQKPVQVSFTPPQYIIETGEEIFDTDFIDVVGTGPAGIAALTLFDQIIEYLDSYIDEDGDPPAFYGSNSLTTNEGFINATYILDANKNFLAEEAVEFVRINYPAFQFDGDACKRDVREYIRAIMSDLKYSSNYKSLMAARYYKNAVLGSSGEDMFYCRDATGVRNMTLAGLVGTITAQPVRYQDTVGPSYISLDPGWGPAHEECWIINRSPYIQRVTTQGYAAVGQKIDGALHNGGNKSITSNDFTQLISDGYGAWVTNNGRAELVSVFTYYANVGYLATNGGIIRATNGNNSYGNFGSVADGRDNTETPISGTLNNRLNEATIAGNIVSPTGAILLLEFNNAGQSYTNAALTLIGSGAGANAIFEDFRDNAIFDVKPIDTEADDFSTLNQVINQTIGGAGYTETQGNAQPHSTPGGDDTGITIAVNDDGTEAQYLGMRIIVLSGPGAGQYGYITEYNTTSKEVLVSRESDDQPGWDHIIPGYPLTSFTTGTTYRIEPRVIFSDPGFESEEITVPVTDEWGAVIYGETSGQYFNIPTQFGTGEVETQDGLTPLVATFDVIKTGRTYSATLNESGAGYAVGDVISASGALLDGVTSENNLIITVTEVSDDSTNSIVDFTVSGVASSGVFVVFPQNSDQILYSYDAENWTASVLPSSGQWTNVAAGEGLLPVIAPTSSAVLFVAIKADAVTVNAAAYSYNGIDWTTTAMPSIESWSAVTYGDGKFVAVAQGTSNAAYSENGIDWDSSTIVSLDSSDHVWVDITYGAGQFVAIANSIDAVAYSDDGITWAGTDISISTTSNDWVGIAYGNGKFVAVASNGKTAYGFNPTFWFDGVQILDAQLNPVKIKSIKYAQGVFLAIGTTQAGSATEKIFKSENGVQWVEETLTSSLPWNNIGFGNPDLSPVTSSLGINTPIWVAVGGTTNRISKIRAGKRALGRCLIGGGRVSSIKIWDPGSAYTTTPTVTLISPSLSEPAVFTIRTSDGVLANPSWSNRGIGYLSNTLTATITGDGVADVVPVGKNISISRLERLPILGAQIEFVGDDTIYTIVTRTQLSEDFSGVTARFRISPELRVRDAFFHDQPVLIRERVSQIRLTGHDFLDIGTGNFEQTNYPEIYSTGLFTPDPENEIDYLNGGVVFYTSTDQLGNFRVGELFQVEQATGIVTLSADFFDLAGLSELRLGGIRIGGTGAIIREFSTDVLFSADSNSVVPTQRAIARYLSGRLTVGGSEIATSSFIAGTVSVGPQLITNTANLNIVIPVQANFTPTSIVAGTIIAQTFFYSSFRERSDF
jgi:hypothetical protein